MQKNPTASFGTCRACGDTRVLIAGYCAPCLPDSYTTGPARYDERATKIVERHIENDEQLLDTVRAIIQRAYTDAEQAQLNDPGANVAPRADAGDALREMFDEANPLYEDGGVYLTLIDFALDRCDWYAIVDHQRRVMEENHRATLAREAERAAIEDAVWSPIWRALNFL